MVSHSTASFSSSTIVVLILLRCHDTTILGEIEGKGGGIARATGKDQGTHEGRSGGGGMCGAEGWVNPHYPWVSPPGMRTPSAPLPPVTERYPSIAMRSRPSHFPSTPSQGQSINGRRGERCHLEIADPTHAATSGIYFVPDLGPAGRRHSSQRERQQH